MRSVAYRVVYLIRSQRGIYRGRRRRSRLVFAAGWERVERAREPIITPQRGFLHTCKNRVRRWRLFTLSPPIAVLVVISVVFLWGTLKSRFLRAACFLILLCSVGYFSAFSCGLWSQEKEEKQPKRSLTASVVFRIILWNLLLWNRCFEWSLCDFKILYPVPASEYLGQYIAQLRVAVYIKW